MISIPIVSMIVATIAIIILIIITVIVLNIDEKELKKEEELENLMIELNIPERDRKKIWRNKKKYELLKTELDKDGLWALYVRHVLDTTIISSYLDKNKLDCIENFDKLNSILLDRTNNVNKILLKSYRKLIWLIEDVKIKNKDKEIIQTKIFKNIECFLNLYELLTLNKDSNFKLKISKDKFRGLNLDNYPLFIANILDQLSLNTI